MELGDSRLGIDGLGAARVGAAADGAQKRAELQAAQASTAAAAASTAAANNIVVAATTAATTTAARGRKRARRQRLEVARAIKVQQLGRAMARAVVEHRVQGAVEVPVPGLAQGGHVELALVQWALVHAAIGPDARLPVPLARQRPEERCPDGRGQHGGGAEGALVAEAQHRAALLRAAHDGAGQLPQHEVQQLPVGVGTIAQPGEQLHAHAAVDAVALGRPR